MSRPHGARVSYFCHVHASLPDEVIDVLRQRFGGLEPAGAGTWSVAFRFERNGHFVVRVGEHAADFEVDASMSSYSSKELPIPVVVEFGRLDPPHDHLYFCVSTYAPGTALDAVRPDEWVALVPRVADLLDALQSIRPPAALRVPAWPVVLLTPSAEDADGRLDGWTERLAERPTLRAGYRTAMRRLRDLCSRATVANVEPTLLHCDLVNRNVHVVGQQITGVFDWGCRRWGDHLYDLAWLEFWQPWHTNLDVALLRAELVSRWGAEPDPDRMTACLVHIGIDHIVYNAVIGDDAAGTDVVDRMKDLGLVDSL